MLVKGLKKKGSCIFAIMFFTFSQQALMNGFNDKNSVDSLHQNDQTDCNMTPGSIEVGTTMIMQHAEVLFEIIAIIIMILLLLPFNYGGLFVDRV